MTYTVLHEDNSRVINKFWEQAFQVYLILHNYLPTRNSFIHKLAFQDNQEYL